MTTIGREWAVVDLVWERNFVSVMIFTLNFFMYLEVYYI